MQEIGAFGANSYFEKGADFRGKIRTWHSMLFLKFVVCTLFREATSGTHFYPLVPRSHAVLALLASTSRPPSARFW